MPKTALFFLLISQQCAMIQPYPVFSAAFIPYITSLWPTLLPFVKPFAMALGVIIVGTTAAIYIKDIIDALFRHASDDIVKGLFPIPVTVGNQMLQIDLQEWRIDVFLTKLALR